GQVSLAEGEEGGQYIRNEYPLVRVRTLDPKTGRADQEYSVPFRPGTFPWKPGRYEVLTDPKDPFQLAAKAYFPASAPRYTHAATREDGRPMIELAVSFKGPGMVRESAPFEGDEQGRWLTADKPIYRDSRSLGPATLSFQHLDSPSMLEDFLHPATE